LASAAIAARRRPSVDSVAAPAPRRRGDAAETAAAGSYSYDPAGRRDPFMNLTGAGSNQTHQERRRSSGIAVAGSPVRGVLQSRSGLIAMVQGPDNKTYIVHQGDKLLDGSIKTITTQGLIIEQDVNDPLSVVKQREVRRLLRGLEDPK
jgi:Tfp pilus assembly protein PilP